MIGKSFDPGDPVPRDPRPELTAGGVTRLPRIQARTAHRPSEPGHR